MVKKKFKNLKQGILLNTKVKSLFKRVFIRIFKTITKLYELNLFLKGKIVSKPDEVVYVPIDLIEYAVGKSPKGHKLLRHYNLGFVKPRIVGMIEKGDWDMNKKRVDLLPQYSIFKDRFVEGKEWEETVAYKLFHTILRNTGAVRGCKNWAEYKEKKLKEYDDIYNQTMKNGYKRREDPQEEIEVVVSRKGEILFKDGRHRLMLAKILNVSEVPVIVNHWHKEFIDEVKRHTGKKRVTPSDAIKIAIEINRLKQP